MGLKSQNSTWYIGFRLSPRSIPCGSCEHWPPTEPSSIPKPTNKKNIPCLIPSLIIPLPFHILANKLLLIAPNPATILHVRLVVPPNLIPVPIPLHPPLSRPQHRQLRPQFPRTSQRRRSAQQEAPFRRLQQRQHGLRALRGFGL